MFCKNPFILFNYICRFMILISEKNTPRWIIFLADVLICIGSLVLAYLLRFNFHIPLEEIARFKYVFPAVIGVRIISFLITRIYAGIIRYTNTRDAVRIFLTVSAGSTAFIFLNIISYRATNYYVVPFSIVIIDYITTVFIMTASRIFVKTLYMEITNPKKNKRDVIIYGAGESGIITKRTLDRDAGSKYKVIAFIDDDENKTGKTLEGVKIYSTKKEFENLLRANPVAHVIISIHNISAQKKKEVIENCLQFNTKVLNVPPVDHWINGQLSFKQIKKVKIEDLLERDPIQLDLDKIGRYISGRRILITGGAGSIGSEIVRQVIPFHPEKLIILDQAESSLYDVELELSERFHQKKFEAIVGDIRNKERMEKLFEAFKPQVVFHAAAYKHVPVMECNPSEAVLANVLGTKNLADLSVAHGVEKFVMVSTDKAVNPTNVMGATKRIAEIYCQSLNKKPLANKPVTTQFITTRFGNVLGSNGSVIPRFKKQIEEGGPITVTHPNITRYFMTIHEACQLVLEAGAIGNGGEIYLFDMGSHVKVADLAKKMVQLSGLEIGKDIQIIYTGLRPGEKLYEELLNDAENTLPTHHPKIMIGKVREYDFATISADAEELIALCNVESDKILVKKMKDMVPEFVSHNSPYTMLDGSSLKESDLVK